MKKIIIWSSILALLSILELIYGVRSTGAKVALVIFSYSLMSIPLALYLPWAISEIKSMDEFR